MLHHIISYYIIILVYICDDLCIWQCTDFTARICTTALSLKRRPSFSQSRCGVFSPGFPMLSQTFSYAEAEDVTPSTPAAWKPETKLSHEMSLETTKGFFRVFCPIMFCSFSLCSMIFVEGWVNRFHLRRLFSSLWMKQWQVKHAEFPFSPNKGSSQSFQGPRWNLVDTWGPDLSKSIQSRRPTERTGGPAGRAGRAGRRAGCEAPHRRQDMASTPPPRSGAATDANTGGGGGSALRVDQFQRFFSQEL